MFYIERGDSNYNVGFSIENCIQIRTVLSAGSANNKFTSFIMQYMNSVHTINSQFMAVQAGSS